MTNRLLHLSWDSPDNPWCGGGGAFRDYQILSRLAWSPEVWSGRHPRGSAAPFQSLRNDLGCGLFGEFVSRRTWAWSAGRLLDRRLRNDSELVVSQSVSAWAPVWQSLNHPSRILHVVHHVAGESILKRLGPLGPSSLRFEQRILSEGHYFVTPNRVTASRIRAVNPTAEIRVIPNGFTPAETSAVPKQADSSKVVICFLGRLDHQMKGLDRLLAAFILVAEKAPQARLRIAGRSDPSMKAWLSKALADHPYHNRIEVIANPSDQGKYALLDDSDIFCVPSRFEGWCIAAIEAQSRGLPVVATRTDGLQDSIADGQTGILVSNSESEAIAELAEGLTMLVQNPAKRLQWGRNAIPWANRFTWESAAQATDSFLLEIRESLTRPKTRRPS